MTELEKEILRQFDWVKEDLIKACREYNHEGRAIKCPFFVDGVVDFAIFDPKKNRFTHIEYVVGKGEGVFATRTNALFDEIEYKILLL